MLYAKDGTTELEATTGEFGSPTPPPGTFWKMQVSTLDALGVVMSTTQYRDLDAFGGYFKQSYTNLWPGQPFQIQAHIRTSSKRNDTVTVTTSVQKRPDIAVSGLVSPPMAPVNLPVKMFAVVSELNGNIGARTDCVLYVNDVEADRAAAIWVDSGDSVSCAFSPTFSTLGTNHLKVRAVGVDPGDWDAANNVFEKTVLVSTLTPEFDAARAEALVYDVNNTSFAQQGRYFNSTFSGGDWLWEEKSDTDGDIWTYTATAAVAPLAAPASVNVSLTDGVLAWSIERELNGCEDFAIGQVNGRTIYTSVIGCGALFVQAGGFSGTVTYTSRRLAATFTVQNGAIVYDGPAQYSVQHRRVPERQRQPDLQRQQLDGRRPGRRAGGIGRSVHLLQAAIVLARRAVHGRGDQPDPVRPRNGRKLLRSVVLEESVPLWRGNVRKAGVIADSGDRRPVLRSPLTSPSPRP